MTKQTMIDVSAVLTTLLEVDPAAAPASAVYLALGANMARYNHIVFTLANAGLIINEKHTLSLTDDGRRLAQELERAIQAHKTAAA